MKYDKDLQILNFAHGDYASPDVEIVHPDAKIMARLDVILAGERIDHKFVSGTTSDRIHFKRISWPKLNYALYLVGLMTLDEPTDKAVTVKMWPKRAPKLTDS